jgi:eukaryotic-like serine/threonine-protein kinase
MTAERRAEVERLYREVLTLGTVERARVLAEACRGDASLRVEVESLLAHEGSPPSSSTPAVALASTTKSATASLIGRQIGPYGIQAPLGAGGMGEVYRARDTKLGRDVALKILPPIFTTDSDRLVRFEREARVLAALNHPHIGAIYGLEESGGNHALVLELVDGSTLADRLAKGSLSIAETLSIAA